MEIRIVTLADQTILQDLGENVDRLCTLDFRPPGPTGGYIGRFYAAVREQIGAPLTLTAAQYLDQIAPGAVVVIATGFCHPERLPFGETDGPPGAAALARAVALGLNATPLVLGEAAIEGPMQACLQTLGVDQAIFQAFPTDIQAAQAAAQDVLTQWQPAAVVVTEKVGPNRLGTAHSAMGFAIPEDARARIEHLLDAAHAANIPTIGVGDNGNDIGFGRIEEIVRQYKPYGDVCQCPCGGGLATVTHTTTLVTATVANWGAYGIVACLAALRRQPALLHSAAEELRMIDACVHAGAADGLSGETVATVDGLSAPVHASIVELLQALIAKVL